jgi:hypothetical protein
MEKDDRRTTDGMAEARRWSSMRPCQSQKATGAPGAAAVVESRMMRRTPGAGRAVDQARLPGHAPRIVGARQRHGVRAGQSRRHGPVVGEIADDELDLFAEHRPRLVGIAHERAHLLPALAQRARPASRHGPSLR